MLKGFVCIDGHKVELDDCFRQCRLGRRCLTLPTLRLVGHQRPQSDKFSTTQLLSGTMLEFLRLTNDYYIVPEAKAFAVLGTMHHGRLESAGEDEITEQTFVDAMSTGTCDILEPEDEMTRIGHPFLRYVLTDYKTWGSYRVARFLGMTYELIDDPTGAVYQKATTSDGRKFAAGHPKQVKIWMPNPLVADTEEVTLQLNDYRLKAEKVGFPISRMQIQITVRDGDTVVAKGRGIDWRMRCFAIDFMDDAGVASYFAMKATDLAKALADDEWDAPCNERESWEGRRCVGYCDVAQFCPQGRELLAKGGMGD